MQALSNVPKVSVIIPNYNHDRYLPKRISSILNQTYQNFEIIYLDDASTDNSNQIFAEFSSDPRIQGIYNEVNTGNPFKQWNKGIREARGEYVWIAESDDYADSRFLEVLINALDKNPTAGFAYCQSWEVDECDQVLSNYQWFTARLDPERWKHDFVSRGIDECKNYVLFQNTIPNASAVVFRKSIYEQVGGASKDMRLSGDWLFWSKLLLESDIAFIAQPLNYFRKSNPKGARGNLGKEGLFLEEKFRVVHYICSQIDDLQENRLKSLHNHVYYWLECSLFNRIPFNRQWTIYQIIRDIDPIINVTLIKMIIAILVKRCLRKLGITPIIKTLFKHSEQVQV